MKPPGRIPAGRRGFVVMLAEPPDYRMYPKGQPWPGLDVRTFRDRRHIEVALVMCRRLKGAGSVMERYALRDLCHMELGRKFKGDKAWIDAFRFAIFGAQRHGWIRTIETDDDVTIARIPGAPCARCKLWLSPAERKAIATQRETPYSALGYDVFQEPNTAGG